MRNRQSLMPPFCHSRTTDFTFSWNLVSAEEYALPENGLGLGIFGIRDGDVIFILFQDQVELNHGLISISPVRHAIHPLYFQEGVYLAFTFPKTSQLLILDRRLWRQKHLTLLSVYDAHLNDVFGSWQRCSHEPGTADYPEPWGIKDS